MTEEKAEYSAPMKGMIETNAIADYLNLTRVPIRPDGIGITAKEASKAMKMTSKNAGRILSEDENLVAVKMYLPDVGRNGHVFLPREYAEENYKDWIVND